MLMINAKKGGDVNDKRQKEGMLMINAKKRGYVIDKCQKRWMLIETRGLKVPSGEVLGGVLHICKSLFCSRKDMNIL